MKVWPKIIVGSLVGVALFSVSYYGVLRQILHPITLPQDTQALLENADAFTLLSINPESYSDQPSTNTFERYEILGRLDIQSKATRTELIDALNEGISADNRFVGPGPRAMPSCFNPRHGIRVKRGDETVDLLICFQCEQIYIMSSSATNQLFFTTHDPAVTFNKVLTDAGVPLAAN